MQNFLVRAEKRPLKQVFYLSLNCFLYLAGIYPLMLANPVVMNVVSQFTVHDSTLGEKAITLQNY